MGSFEQRVPDEALAALVRGDDAGEVVKNYALPIHGDALVTEVAAELVHRRKMARQDSRTADQVKRMRWAAETLVSKAEDLVERVGDMAKTFKEVSDGKEA